MAKISTYPSDSSVSLSDKLIGTDAENANATKNYLISDILGLVDFSGYVPYTGATGNVDLGANNFSANALSSSTASFNEASTGDLYVNGVLYLDGDEGTSGYVLTSNGPGNIPGWEPIPTPSGASGVYGSYSNPFAQSVTAINTPQSVEFSSTIAENGVSLVSLTQLTMSQIGTYEVEVSFAVNSTSGTNNFWSWISKNGVDVVGSNGFLSLNGLRTVTRTFTVTCTTIGDYFKIKWVSSSVNLYLYAGVLAYGPDAVSSSVCVKKIS